MNIFKKTLNALKNDLFLSGFLVFVCAYVILLLISPQLAPTDDFIFLRTLQSGKPILYYSSDFPYYDAATMGRFTPLAAMEYNLFGIFSKSPDPFWYYFYHAIQLVILSILIVKILSLFTKNKLLIYSASVLLFLTPGFAISWFRMQMNERNVIFFLTIFLFFYLNYIKNKKITFILLSLIFVNLAIYYKETAFIAIGAFAFFHLIFSIKAADLKLKIFDGLLLLSSLIYLIFYYFYTYINRGANIYGNTSFDWIVSVKNILNYALFSDPLLILVLLPLALWRLFKIIFKKERVEPVMDSLLISAFFYVAAFFALNMYGPYYLLPAYVLTLPVLIYFFNQYQLSINFWKFFGGITALLFIINVIPSGLHYLTYYKYLPINFNNSIDFIIRDINSKNSSKQANIFMGGVDRGTGRGTYFVLAEFLRFKGLSDNQFDLKSNVRTETPLPLISKITVPFTVFKNDNIDEIKSGDYLVILPQSTKVNVTDEYLNLLNQNYTLIFQTKSTFAFPQFNLKTLAKYLISKNVKENKVIVNENLMEWPDYYVFVRK
ncbi:MAG: hypothetical protein QMD86_00200 [Patescibacteria group bacterium]|nr:hypothetical protein [Patescibacteria group bacterium]